MELRILGTAAAEGWPGLFCHCASCIGARRRGGRDLRSRSGALWGTAYKIDFPPDSYHHALRDRLDFSAIEHLLVTHAHEDHFYPQDLRLLRPPFASQVPGRELHVYGDEHVRERLAAAVPDWEESGLRFYLVRALEPFAAGELAVIPLPADHYREKSAFLYLIRHGERQLFWGLDSGWYPEETWTALETASLAAAVIDCTHGPLPGNANHLNIDGVIAVCERLRACGAAGEQTVFVATHFSHNGGLSQAELEEAFAGTGIQVAFDGLTLEV